MKTTISLPKAGWEEIFTYVEALSFLPKFYATDSKILKETSDIAWV